LSSGLSIALAALVIAVALAGVAYWTTRRQDRIEANQHAILGTHDEHDLVAHALDLEEQVRNLREAVTILTEEVERYRHDLDAALSNLAVVRFDAFRDSGGEQSASIALLDNYRSGVVISVFASRELARIYVKYLDHGVPDRELAPEEEEAVRRAVPQPLPRGELSRAPVSSFPRDVRRAVEQVRQAAAKASQEAAASATAPDEGATGADIAAQSAPAMAATYPEPAAVEPGSEPSADALLEPTAGAQAGQATQAEQTAANGTGDEGAVQEQAHGRSGPPRERSAKRHDDWLGGDNLDF
jgi:hypothetical protein